MSDYEDEASAGINKPAGLSWHPAAGPRRGTLLKLLLQSIPRAGQRCRAPGIVHRRTRTRTGFDGVQRRWTSADQSCQISLQERTVTREYECVVVGVNDRRRQGRPAISRKGPICSQMAVMVGGKQAVPATIG